MKTFPTKIRGPATLYSPVLIRGYMCEEIGWVCLDPYFTRCTTMPVVVDNGSNSARPMFNAVIPHSLTCRLGQTRPRASSLFSIGPKAFFRPSVKGRKVTIE